MHTWSLPYKSVGDKTITVTTSTSIDLGGNSAVIHNTGTDKLYFSGNPNVTTDSPELAVGEKTFPRTGILYLLSAGTSKLKIEFIDVM